MSPCLHFGSEIGRKDCPRCPPDQRTQLKLFHCRKFGQCTPQTEIPGISCCKGCPEYEGEEMQSSDDTRWAYGITTVPSRKETTFRRTLCSLQCNGFPQPHLFIDGARQGYEEFSLDQTYHYRPVRPYGNWILALAELYIKNPTAHRYALFQDDFVCSKNLRAYLNSCVFPTYGYWNLFSFRENENRPEFLKARGWVESNQMGRGAVGLVFNREGVQLLLCSQPTHERSREYLESQRQIIKKPTDASNGYRSIDGCVVEAMRTAGWTEYIHNPSLIQHTGKFSTIRNYHTQSVTFRGEDFDLASLVGG